MSLKALIGARIAGDTKPCRHPGLTSLQCSQQQGMLRCSLQPLRPMCSSPCSWHSTAPLPHGCGDLLSINEPCGEAELTESEGGGGLEPCVWKPLGAEWCPACYKARLAGHPSVYKCYCMFNSCPLLLGSALRSCLCGCAAPGSPWCYLCGDGLITKSPRSSHSSSKTLRWLRGERRALCCRVEALSCGGGIPSILSRTPLPLLAAGGMLPGCECL